MLCQNGFKPRIKFLQFGSFPFKILVQILFGSSSRNSSTELESEYIHISNMPR